MGFVKLQFGCLLVILYIVITYLKAILKRKIVLSREFNLLMFVAPIAVLFDGITAWTVNHMNIASYGMQEKRDLHYLLLNGRRIEKR